ncbi:MAG TPA: amidohydrolase family protein [Streptosporangiaceae bacterium]|jgi:cytosine/adenosine deaminase-related metal-dependent hydrolase
MRTLIRNACVIDTEPHPYARHGIDVLIDGATITQVAPGLPADGAHIIDATGRIVLPGLVDTHRHTWQAAIRGTAYDTTFPAYLDRVVHGLAPELTADDMYAGNLAGARECLAGGVTTLLDWSHNQRTPAHTDAAVQALRDSGIRAVFGYAHPAPDRPRPDELRRAHAMCGGLVRTVLAAWGPGFTDMAATTADWRLARELGIRISVHVNGAGPVARLAGAGLLGADTTYVHGNGVTDDELRLIADTGGTASITPLTESVLGMGAPEIARLRAYGVPTGIGADAVTTVTGDLFAHMRSVLAFGRAADPTLTSADVLRMATLDGAATLGMADRIGSLRPGKQADLALLRPHPGLAAAADPVAAVVATATAADVESVLVAGVVG